MAGCEFEAKRHAALLSCEEWPERRPSYVAAAQTVNAGSGGEGGKEMEAAAGIEPAMEVLQTSALPLGYAAPSSE